MGYLSNLKKKLVLLLKKIVVIPHTMIMKSLNNVKILKYSKKMRLSKMPKIPILKLWQRSNWKKIPLKYQKFHGQCKKKHGKTNFANRFHTEKETHFVCKILIN